MNDFLFYIAIFGGGLIIGTMLILLKKNLLKRHPSNFINEATIRECLTHVQEDYLPFNDIFRTIYGFNKTQPSAAELENTFQLFSYLVREKGLTPIFGPEMKPSGRTIHEDLEYIHEKLKDERYEAYSYGVWLSLAD